MAVPSLALAQEESFFPGTFSGSAALTTDYVFRGISQTDESPAVQAGFTYKHNFDENAGYYLGLWGSNVDYNDNDDSTMEIDYIGGVTYQLGKLALDTGFIYYTYPGADSSRNYDYLDVQLTAGYDFEVAYLQGSIFYSPDYFGGSGDSYYTKLAGEVPLPCDFKMLGSVGRMVIDENATYGTPDYYTWTVGTKYNLEGFDLMLEYIDTDMDDSECSGLCGGRGVFTVSRSF